MSPLGLACLLQARLTASSEHEVTNIFSPLASPAGAESRLGYFVFGITGAIFLVVAAMLTYTLIRFRRKSEDTGHQEPAQVYGSNQIELAWTVIPLLIVFVLLGVTARVVASIQDAKPKGAAVRATVIGHQFWWEIRYPEFGIATANEMHVPVADDSGHATYIKLQSMDVVHSFWVPQLSGKTDAIPNRDNTMWIDPRQPGLYLGNCAEFCGTQHANMMLRVIAQPRAEFDQWVAAQKQQVTARTNKPRAVYESLSCVSCHNIQGTVSKGLVGPDLTHLMSRATLGAGVVANTPVNLRAWINDPQKVKPGCLMPSLQLTDPELNGVVAYLATLR